MAEPAKIEGLVESFRTPNLGPEQLAPIGAFIASAGAAVGLTISGELSTQIATVVIAAGTAFAGWLSRVLQQQRAARVPIAEQVTAHNLAVRREWQRQAYDAAQANGEEINPAEFPDLDMPGEDLEPDHDDDGWGEEPLPDDLEEV